MDHSPAALRRVPSRPGGAVIFQQFFLESLGHASYLLGSEETGEAFVVDVRRDVDQYHDFARSKGLRIAHAADTHQHNDYLTGITELQGRSPVELVAGARAELGYRARQLDDGERFRIGEVEIETLHTPGHTPEHVSFLVRDRARGDEPVLLLSGGALLVDDVARPDLLGGHESALKGAESSRATLRDKIFALPDHVMVFPTHVAGSLCGGNVGSMLMTTVGYERRLNGLARCLADGEKPVDECIDFDRLPVVPPYWKRMRSQNQQGPAPIGVPREPLALSPGELESHRDDGAVLLDCRSPEAFGGGHVPGSLNVGLGSSFPTWAGSVLPPDHPVLLVVDDPSDLSDATWHLLRIGYDVPMGWLAGGIMAWRTSGRPLSFLTQWTVDILRRELDASSDLLVLDVRQPAEWASGRVPGALHLPAGQLLERHGEVPRDRPVAVYCGSGFRSSVAASFLEANGHEDLRNVLGGFAAWSAAGHPVDS